MFEYVSKWMILPRYKKLLSEQGWQLLQQGVMLASASGLVRGLALVVILPALTALITGEPAWGMGFWLWIVILAILAVAGAVIEYQLAIVGYKTALDLLAWIHRKIGDQVATLPLGWFDADSPGVYSRMVSKELMNLGQGLAHMIMPIIQNGVALLVVMVASLFWNWQLAVALMITVPVMAGLVVVSRRFHDHGKSISEPTEQELAARVVEFATCQGSIRACGLGTDYPQITQAVASNEEAHRKNLIWSASGMAISGVFNQIIIITLIVLAAALVVTQVLTPVEGIAYIGMSLKFFDILTEIQNGAVGIEDRRKLLDLLDDIFAAPVLPEVVTSVAQPTPGSIELDDVYFGYSKDTPVLNGVSFTIAPQSMCAIVGPSGCGKTTIARLISRFYDVDAGTIRVGGTDVRQLTIEDLMEQVSMVFQDVYLFDESLEANIRVGRDGTSEEDVLWASRLAGVEEIVSRLPHGYQTLVGEGGRALSGGERQRVSVARALLKKAPIVLLDEATSALDAENEANIVASMEVLREQSTLVVIAHKLDTIRTADQVVVLSPTGRVAQIGTHTELIAQEGPYKQFWKSREEAEGWKLV